MMEENPPQERTESDVHALFGALRRRFPLILICITVAGGTALGISLAQQKEYTATASLLFRDPGFDSRLFGSSVFTNADPAREAATNVGLVSLEAVADRTAAALPGSLAGDDIAAMIDVQAEGQADLVSVAATDTDPRFAAKVANTFASTYIKFRRDADRSKIQAAQQSIEANLATLEGQEDTASEVSALQRQLSQLRTLEALQTGNAELVQAAEPPTSSSSPQTRRNVALAAFLGLLLGTGLALLTERLDRRLRTPAALESTYDLPALAHVPLASTLGSSALTSDNLPFAEGEAFRLLLTKLRYFNVDRRVNSILVTSAMPGEGKSTVAWNLARASASAGARTILIEADFHQPIMAARTGLSPLPGLAELLTLQSRLESVVQGIEAGDDGSRVDVIVAGALPPAPMELLESKSFGVLMGRLKEAYDMIVIDTPPATVIADAIPIITRIDGVLVVGRLGATTRDAAAHLRDQLNRLGAPVLGLVINGVTTRKGYGYGYYDGAKTRNVGGSAGLRARAGLPRSKNRDGAGSASPVGSTDPPDRD